jgi:uncharacterized protein
VTSDLTKEQIRERLSPLFKEKELRLVLLFGSMASGTGHKHSDVDIGFLRDGPADIVELTNEVSRFLGTDRVDVVDLSRASPLLRFAASRKGVVLYERQRGLFTEFYSLSYRMYADAKKLRDARDRTVYRFLQSRGSV